MADLDPEFMEVVLKGNKKLIHQYLIIKKDKCAKVSDVLCHLGGVYEFHPVIKHVIVAKNIYQHYRMKLMEHTDPSNGFVYFIDEFISDNGNAKLICSITKDKKTRIQRARMVCRAVIFIKICGKEDVAFVRIYHLPCKRDILQGNMNYYKCISHLVCLKNCLIFQGEKTDGYQMRSNKLHKWLKVAFKLSK